MLTLMDTGLRRRDFLRWLGRGVATGALAGSATARLLAKVVKTPSIPADRSPDVVRDERFWRTIRAQFPLTRDRVYLNNGGLGPSPFQVIEAVEAAMRRLESISETGHEEIERVRQKAAAFLDCAPDEIAFTRNTTEGMNLIARGLPLKAGDEVLMSTHEHVGGSMPWLALMKEKGIRIQLFEPGRTWEENLEIIERKITPRTRVLSVSHMTCTIGQIFPGKALADLCHSKGVWLVFDGAHPPGQMRVSLHDLDCDFYATSGHKWLLGPKGTGILYVKRDMHDIWTPTMVGAYSASVYDLDNLKVEYLKRASAIESGTRGVPLVLGLGAAIEFLETIGIDRIEARNRYLAARLRAELEKIADLEILTPTEERSHCGIVAFRPKRMPYTQLVDRLARAKFRVRPVGEHRLNAVRVSCHLYTLTEDVEHLVVELKKILQDAA